MAVQRVYRDSGEGAQASFDFVDIASGIGFTEFLGTATRSSAGTSYALITNVIPSAVIATRQTGAGTTTLTFDSPLFNLPRTIKGTALFSAAVINTANTTNWIWAQISKYDGTTQTNITASQAYTLATSASQAILFSMPCTQTIIKKDESLRLVVSLVCPGADNLTLGHDPADRDSSLIDKASNEAGTTKLRLLTPFRIDL